MGYILQPRKIDHTTILHVINLISGECPNNDEGGMCWEYEDCGGCLQCWKEYLIKNSDEIEHTENTMF